MTITCPACLGNTDHPCWMCAGLGTVEPDHALARACVVVTDLRREVDHLTDRIYRLTSEEPA